ncbi:uncharacterized protein LOC127877889 [Dreissena polymorpha]|uniref:Ig-like domain-containing protein n=1 Tax=Dreissena polymorpha TaxID=45954 RepID=A0A9D4HCG6_DREPO|nr:uncharacterized protein LOC127877889 [Dreissena polymorpha]KAH3831690.1 hypothetical protein DPMN_104960 [Dreissena polymorpha]
MIRVPPSNQTAVAGTDARFTCQVSERRDIDYVFWKKVTVDGFTDVISYNLNLLNTSKYAIEGDFTLQVRNVHVQDEAWYECQAGVDRARAHLAVEVMAANMTLVGSPEPPFKKGAFVNITCSAYHSRPPVHIRWYHGRSDITSLAAHSCSQIYGPEGFSDTTSMLTITVTDDRHSIRCVASLPGTNISRTEFWNPLIDFETSDATRSSRYSSLLGMSVSAICVLVYVVTWSDVQ